MLPRVLDRINPQGRGLPRQPRQPEFAGLGERDRGGAFARPAAAASGKAAAGLATQIAAEMRPTDHRLGVSLLTLGRLSLRQRPGGGGRATSPRRTTCSAASFGPDDVRTAQAGVHLAAMALGTGQYEAAIGLADRHVPAGDGRRRTRS